MRRYAAFLRGVTPMNAKMQELKKCFERAGFGEVRTLLSSGNVIFSARPASDASLVQRAEAAMQKQLGRTFLTIVRPVDTLHALIATNPYRGFRLVPNAKRVVTFLRDTPDSKLVLPVELEGARILCVIGAEVFTAYVPGSRGPVFMSLIERAFGTALTTRTWDTVKKVATADTK